MSKIDKVFSKKVIELVQTIPNDMALGEKIRRLYFESENINTNETKKGNDPCVCGRQATGENCKSIV
jgi:hypothetical protein